MVRFLPPETTFVGGAKFKAEAGRAYLHHRHHLRRNYAGHSYLGYELEFQLLKKDSGLRAENQTLRYIFTLYLYAIASATIRQRYLRSACVPASLAISIKPELALWKYQTKPTLSPLCAPS